ncbi:hypothetical protein NE237_016041 [Protea cynaroides]|uniref:Uncharacterized protein n=1 Tax=Protea cynaroides TaxID=273540 RepID=A0A9Q0QRH9_9MAGN|nr:hypothetical protein NE237_016041 [Protea cynaroides]
MKKISEIRIKDHFRTRKSPTRRGSTGGRSSRNLSPSRISHEEAKEVDQLVKYRCEEVRPLFPVEVTCTDLRSSLCLGEASKNQVTISSKHLEPQNSQLEIFSRKRQKLRQWLAEATSLEVDDISSKGYDVASVLLQRLVPQGNAREICMPPSSRYKELSTRSQLLASPDSDMHFKELLCTRTPCPYFIEPTARQHLVEDSSVCRSNKSRVVTCSQSNILDSDSLSTRNTDIFDAQWDMVDSDLFSTENVDIFDLQYRKLQPYCASDDENATVMRTKMKPCWFIDMDGDFLKRNGSLPQDQVPIPSKLESASQKSFSSLWHSPNPSFGPSNNLSCPGEDEFHPNDFALGIGNLTKFLDQNDTDPCNSVLKVSPTRAIILRDKHKQSLRKSDAIGLDSSPLPAIHHSACMTSLLDFWSERYHYQTIERSLEENDYSVAVMKHLPLNLSCYQSYLSQGCRLPGRYSGTGIFNHPHSRHSFMSQVFSKKLCPNVDTLVLPSGLDPDFRWKNLLMNDSLGEHQSSICPKYKLDAKQTQNGSSPLLNEEQSKWTMDDSSETEIQKLLSEEIFNIHDLSSLNFRMSLDKERLFPLLFDKSSIGWM